MIDEKDEDAVQSLQRGLQGIIYIVKITYLQINSTVDTSRLPNSEFATHRTHHSIGQLPRVIS